MPGDFERRRRNTVRGLNGFGGAVCEVFDCAGGVALFEYQAHPLDWRGVQILNTTFLPDRFAPVAKRMASMIGRYYDELSSPSVGFHPLNVKSALRVGTGCMLFVRPAISDCRAPSSLVEKIFELILDSVGGLAKADTAIDAVRLQAMTGDLFYKISEYRRRAECFNQRIVA